MLMPKKHRTLIYEYLMKEGVVVAEKDFGLDKHPAIAVPNIHVIKALQSLKSRNLVKEQFAWRHYYWYLNNDGTNFLREYLNLPPEIVPATLKRPTRPEGSKIAKRVDTARPSSPSGDQSRQEYRRAGYDKQGEVGAGSSRPEFRGGYGRGRGFNDGNRSGGYNDGNRSGGYNDGNRSGGFNDGNRGGGGFNDGNRGGGFNDSNRGGAGNADQ